MRRRTPTAGLALALFAAMTASLAGTSASAAPTATLAAAPDVSVANVQAHLSQLNTIATNNGGTRRAGSAGYTASVAYVKSKLQAAGYTVTEQTCTSCTYPASNLIAEWPQGPADQVIMFGAHLDSVSAGPGINDNGSGSATLLENALVLASQNPTMTKRVRFAWWNGEEQGLQGSNFYVSRLTSTEKSYIKAYYNFDMIGSPNGGYFINRVTSTTAAPLKAYWDSFGLQPEENTEGQGRSDDYSFANAGIQTSGYAAGASYTKTSAQASKWGGTAGAAYDSCYHKACDTTSNINATILDRSADGVAYTIWQLAVGGTPANDFSLSVSPTSGTIAQGGSTTATVSTATTSGSAQTVNLSAAGAPSGVSVSFSPSSVTSGSSSTMTVSASSTATTGTYSITITGTGGSATHTTTYTLTVTGTGTCSGGQIILNGGFESGTSPWTATSGVITSSSSQPAHAGTYKAWLDGYGSSHTDSLSQTVTIPAGCTSYLLTFWLHIDTAETTTSTAYDKLTLQVGSTVIATYSNLNAASGYQQRTFNLGAFAGQTVTIKWTGVEDASLQTSFVIDDVALQVS